MAKAKSTTEPTTELEHAKLAAKLVTDPNQLKAIAKECAADYRANDKAEEVARWNQQQAIYNLGLRAGVRFGRKDDRVIAEELVVDMFPELDFTGKDKAYKRAHSRTKSEHIKRVYQSQFMEEYKRWAKATVYPEGHKAEDITNLLLKVFTATNTKTQKLTKDEVQAVALKAAKKPSGGNPAKPDPQAILDRILKMKKSKTVKYDMEKLSDLERALQALTFLDGTPVPLDYGTPKPAAAAPVAEAPATPAPATPAPADMAAQFAQFQQFQQFLASQK